MSGLSPPRPPGRRYAPAPLFPGTRFLFLFEQKYDMMLLADKTVVARLRRV